MLGVPTEHSLNGLDAILSTLQMPAGVPVATFAAGTAGATNAGIFAAQMLGIQDIVAKSLGSQNPYNMIRATISGLTKEWSPRMVAQRRGKKVAEINFK